MSNNPFKKKRQLIVPESAWGVCLWEMPEGGYLADEPGSFLSIEGPVGDRKCEEILRKAAEYYVGCDTGGRPAWRRGVRKVTNNEWDDQQERLRDGQIPDWEEEWRLAARKDGGV